MVVLGRTLVLLSAIIIAECKEKNNMYMENSGSEDMEMSASGYDYQTHSGRPFGYSHSSDSNKFNNFQYPPLGYGYYKYQPLPLRSTPLSPNYVPGHYERLFNSYGVPLSYAAYAEPVKGYENLMDPTNTGISEASNYGLGSNNFVKGGGSSYEDAKKVSHRENGRRGYLSGKEYERGSKGQHENEQQGGYYNKASGNKVGYQDIANHYGNKEQASKGSLGESFSDKKGHNKDSKTTGYHKVYYKDDYKKDHSFYDKADRRGHFKKYSDYDAKDDAQQGAFDKGGHYDNGFKGNVYKAKGLSDKSRFVDESSGHTGAAGKQKYYQNNSEYANKARKEFGKEQGFSDDDKYSVGQ